MSTVPTLDGPVHVYNAWVLHHLHDPALPHIERHFELALSPVPNWLIQALLYVLLFVSSPPVAEKLLLTVYVLSFGAVGWWFAGCQHPARRAHALLVLPFVYNVTLHLGFYNFAFSVPLALLAVGLWWRWRERLGLRRALALNAVLLACYFAHLVSLAVALLAIGVLWMATFSRCRWRAWLLHPLALAPQLVLPVWYVSSHASSPTMAPVDLGVRWALFSRLHVLFSFRSDYVARHGLALFFLALVLLTLLPRRTRHDGGEPSDARIADGHRGSERHAFLLAAAVVAALLLVVPDAFGPGHMVVFRLALFPYLLAIPGLTSGFGRAIHGALAIALALLVAWAALGVSEHHRTAARGVEAYLAGLARVRPHSRLLALSQERATGLAGSARTHASHRVAVQKALVDWDDYQAATDHFPVRFRPHVARPQVSALDPSRYDANRYALLVDYLYLWRVPVGSPLRPRVRAAYRLLDERADWQLWVCRPRVSRVRRRAEGPVPLQATKGWS